MCKNGKNSDNHVIEHPIHSDEKLFLLNDTTHILKNVFNNFHVRRNLDYPCPDSLNASAHAHYDDLKTIVAREAQQGLRGAHKLSRTILAPTSIGKVSAKYALGK